MPELPTITIENLILFHPCYNEQQMASVLKLAETRERWNALDILECDQFPVKDVLWVVLRERLIPAELLHEFGCRVFEHRLNSCTELSPVFRQRMGCFIEVKRQWIAEGMFPLDRNMEGQRQELHLHNKFMCRLNIAERSLSRLCSDILSNDARIVSYHMCWGLSESYCAEFLPILRTVLQEKFPNQGA